jgi:DnaJ-class molecular chaperone
MQRAPASHYATLGLDRRCTPEQIRTAYRVLARQHHPDLNPGSPTAITRTQELNAAYACLSDLDSRQAYDRELDASRPPARAARAAKIERNISQEVHLRIEEFLRGVTLEVRVNDPGNPGNPETYPLVVPPETAPGTRFRLAREAPFTGGFVVVKTWVRPDFRFKVRGSDLRCDLKLKLERATQGGTEMIRGVTGAMLRVLIPRGIGRGEIIRLPGEGLPKPRGGRGDLLVRVTYRPEVRITRASGR